jgi:hypothetical protein
MNVQAALKSQYHAALLTLREAIEKCPEELWHQPADGSDPCWRVAYHTLYYTHRYLQQKADDFVPWVKHQPGANNISRPPKGCKPYSKKDLLSYWRICNGMVDKRIEALDLDAPRCGFKWYLMPTLEHQLVNIRHIQHHSAILSYRIRRASRRAIQWVSKG